MEHKDPSSSLFQGASPKLTFIFGIIAGVAATSLIVLLVTFINPSDSSSSTKTATTTTTGTTTPPADSGSGTGSFGSIPPIGDNDYIRGSGNAKVTFVEYSDYECPFCKTFHPTMERVLDEYGDDVAWVYRHFPLSFHNPGAQKQAEAALCVGKLEGGDAFWEFTDKIFERTSSNGNGFPIENLGPLAAEVGANESDFQACLDGGEMAAQVASDISDGTGAGASGTPTTFMVDSDWNTITAIPGALPYDQVKTQLDQILATL